MVISLMGMIKLSTSGLSKDLQESLSFDYIVVIAVTIF